MRTPAANKMTGCLGGPASGGQPTIIDNFVKSLASASADAATLKPPSSNWAEDEAMVEAEVQRSKVHGSEDQGSKAIETRPRSMGRQPVIPKDLSKYPGFPEGQGDKAIIAFWKTHRKEQEQAKKRSRSQSG